jgi:glyoxylase-like metal-dependent hydrolase (beta-lactamase superfamily II)
MSSIYRIRPILTGKLKIDQGQYLTWGRGLGSEVTIPATAWVIEGGPYPILVDTGMSDTERACKWHHQGVQEPGQDMPSQVRKLGIEPEEVGMLILTHLHWDHTFNMKAFSRARNIVHRRELHFAMDPIPQYFKSYEAYQLGLTAPFKGVQFELVDGEVELLPGIKVFPTFGHCPGHQSVEVMTEKGPYVIAGDAVMLYDNLRGDPETKMPLVPPSRYTNALESWESLKAIVGRASYALPGHDLRVFDKEVYP